MSVHPFPHPFPHPWPRPRARTAPRHVRATGLLAAVAAMAVLAAASLPAAPAEASTAGQSYPVPAGGTFTLHGHGFGHGHGMSQYGAYGAARRGLGYRQILAFYYPGTSRSTVSGDLRVLVSADTTDDVRVSPAAGLRVRDLGAGTTYRLPTLAGVRRWRLNVDHGRTVVGYLTSAWHRYRPGGHATLAGDGQLRADGPLTLWTPAGSRTYRGALRAASPRPGSSARDTVDVVSVDAYVRGVIASEMPASWSASALRAQAVAARTYAAWSRAQAAGRPAQVCDTSACQVYRGVDAEDPRTDAAVAATAREILTYGGAAAFTQFGSSSGGWTSAGSRPYLVARADPYDAVVASSAHTWTVRLDATRIQHAYPQIGTLRRLHVTRRDGHGQWGGRVVTVVLDGTKRDVSLSGEEFRSTFGLRSSWFAA